MLLQARGLKRARVSVSSAEGGDDLAEGEDAPPAEKADADVDAAEAATARAPALAEAVAAVATALDSAAAAAAANTASTAGWHRCFPNSCGGSIDGSVGAKASIRKKRSASSELR